MKILNWLLAGLVLSSPLFGDQPKQVAITESLDFRTAPIDYLGHDVNDCFARIKSQVDGGKTDLKPRESSGYLLDLLKTLNISVDSQTLVFSRSSLQEKLINPKNPRALYFNDEIAVGWIPGAPVIEIAAQDPAKGVVFYTVDQPVEGAPYAKPVIKRDFSCTECHASSATMGVPGYLLRSFAVDEYGERDTQSEVTDITHSSPYSKRWGGWFVTGKSDKMFHAGNLFGDEDLENHEKDPLFRGTVTDLTPLVNLSQYPSSHSDIVALLILDHQAHFYNLVTRVHFEYRLNTRSDAEERLARYALMEDEAPLNTNVQGSTNYAKWYQAQGTRDSKGRSLRDLNLKTRLFEHRLSPLVNSVAFRGLPEEVKSRLMARFRAERGDLLDWNPANVTTVRITDSRKRSHR